MCLGVCQIAIVVASDVSSADGSKSGGYGVHVAVGGD